MAEQRRLLAADGAVLLARHLPGPPGAPVVVLAHGFTGSWDRPDEAGIAERIATQLSVVALDLRGHGGSTGASTLGYREVLDVEAGVGWARLLGHDRVATWGFSMGGGAVLRHAAQFADVAAVIAVSAPARWGYQGTVAMRRAHWAVSGPVQRALLRAARGTRVSMAEWEDDVARWPEDPRTAAQRIDVPLLVVHGDSDHYFPLDHAWELGAAPSATLWIEPGFGHAENAVTPQLLDRIAGWLLSQDTEGEDPSVRVP